MWYKAQKVKKYALNSQLQALQILTNDDEVENCTLSSFLLAVTLMLSPRNSSLFKKYVIFSFVITLPYFSLFIVGWKGFMTVHLNSSYFTNTWGNGTLFIKFSVSSA